VESDSDPKPCPEVILFAALEFATGCNAIVTGKPDPAFFRIGLDSLGLGMEQDVFHKNDEKFDKKVSTG
jgi:hypothetical protein